MISKCSHTHILSIVALPSIRHGSVERLLERLTDLRFLSIDFLNTFLLTYRVFTTGEKVLDSLKKVYRSLEGYGAGLEAELNREGESVDKYVNKQAYSLCSVKSLKQSILTRPYSSYNVRI